MEHIHKCLSCKAYSMEEKCPKCAQNTSLAKSPKFSLEDKYAKYKREEKKKELIKRGLY